MERGVLVQRSMGPRLIIVGSVAARHRRLVDWLSRIADGFSCGGTVALDARCAPLRNGLRRLSNRSPVRRNGNWKIKSRDWRHKTPAQEPKVWKLLSRDSGAPA